MGTPKDGAYPLINKGLVLKQDPSLLEPGQYSQLTNMATSIEGVLSVRAGTQELYQPLPVAHSYYLHTMARLVVPFATTQRYIGIGPNIYRSASPVTTSGWAFAQVATGVATTATVALQRWGDADYGSEGSTLVFKFFACQNAMLKDNGALATLQNWGIVLPSYPATAVNSGSGSGPVAFTGAEVPYTYVYTFLNPNTGAESNPSIIMPASIGVTPNGTAITVTVHGSSDLQIPTTSPSINIYRAGGSFGDGLYRFVGQVYNPGSVSGTATFSDTNQDQDILSNNIVSYDNDPPVPSGLPTSFVGTTTATGSAGTVISANVSVLTTTPGYFPRPGDTINVATGLSTYEQAVVITSNASVRTLQFYTQLGQSATPYSIISEVQTNAPCTLALTAFESIFLAGDANNPNFLYQSKPNQPESFPVIQATTGIIQTLSVGTPSNPINGITDYGNAVICLNSEAIYVVPIFQNQMQQPVKTPARHGLIVRRVFIKASNEIWYLSYDGIYVYAGGEEKWMTEPLDPLFKGQPMNGYAPVDFSTTGVSVMTMTTVRNEILFNYQDINGNAMVMRYELNFQRWRIEQYYVGTGNTIYMQFSEPDTGYSYIGQNIPGGDFTQPQLDLIDTGTTDGWTTNPAGGLPIAYSWSPTTMEQPPTIDKLFSDITLETANTDVVAINARYDWSLTNDATDVFSIAAGTRHRYPFPLQLGVSNGPEGKLAYAMQLLISGSATGATNFYSLAIHYEELAPFKKGMSMDYSDLGYPEDKIVRSITLEIDTGNVAATIYLDVDGQLAVWTTTVTTTYYDRKVTLSPPSNIVGQMMRIRYQAGTGGKTNIFGPPQFEVLKEPPALTAWDSYEITMGYDGFSFLKQLWLTYQCNSPLVIGFYVSNDTFFYSLSLPVHTWRDVERFYLPSVWNNVLNKSKVHRITITSTSPFKLYSSASRIEWLPCGSDQRMDYEQLTISEMMQPT
jgi:hypothetical protein